MNNKKNGNSQTNKKKDDYLDSDDEKVKEKISLIGILFIVATVLITVLFAYLTLYLRIYDLIILILFGSFLFLMFTICYYGFRHGKFMEIDMKEILKQADEFMEDMKDEAKKQRENFAYIS